MSEAVIKAVDERISALKGLLGQSVGLLGNRIGHCNCLRAEPCDECVEGESLIQDIEQAIQGE